MSRDRERFLGVILTDPRIAAILDRAGGLGLDDWWLTGGALFQCVWNALTGRPTSCGIHDYDLFYFDARDLSWEAEDGVIHRAEAEFADLGVPIQVRNEARVHLWYEARFGRPAPRFRDSRDAIDHFACTSAFGVTRTDEGLDVHAPFGFDDLFTLTVRPNPRLATRDAYEAKADRWRREWPALTVLPWSDRTPPVIAA